jgi:biopolymer transport protein ExbB/TolQ
MITEKLLGLSASWGAEWVMWVLIVISLYGLTVFLDRLALFVRTRERFPALRGAFTEGLRRGDLAAAAQAVAGDSLVRNVLRAGLTRIARGERGPEQVEQAMLAQLAEERARYDARLSGLATIGNTAPLIGLLGTVIGIVAAFYALGQLGTAQAAGNSLVMAAIGEALVATGFSIGVAVPAVVAFNMLRAHVGTRLKQAEVLMRDLLASLPGIAAGAPAGAPAAARAPAPRAEG